MLKLPKEIKLQLFNLIKTQNRPFGDEIGQEGIIPFLNQIWPLSTMPSEDPRFHDAFGDAYQHLVNNSDWENDYLFLNRFKLLDKDEDFNRFLEAVVSPEARISEDEIVKFILLISPLIEKENYVFAVDGHSDAGLPIYKLRENTEGADFIFDLKPNSIPFFVDWYKNGRDDKASSHSPPPKFPAFVLVFNDGWNDFRILSQFYLYYYHDQNSVSSIGPIKIISNSISDNIKDDLPDNFLQLDQHFCSLGQTLEFYTKLKNAINRDFESALFGLRDTAFFPDNHDRFENNKKFLTSVVRFDEAERMLRTAKYVIYSYDLQNLYTFSYIFKPLYASNPVTVDFEFSKDTQIGNRIYAIIGKNGTGKTQLISSLPIDISEERDNLFVPSKIPYFSKVITVSYSVFDQFEVPRKSRMFNYVYCGLRKNKNEPFSEKGLVLRFYSSWKNLVSKGRLVSWKRIINSFISESLTESFIEPSGETFIINPIKFQQAKVKFSSGQSIVLYVITEIIANIRFDSLLLFDEPETHLHPNAITELMQIIYHLVNEFQSYCIIATHSPLIIRELFSRNVYVLEREEDIP
ncbi:MAG TPA: AAA family ATPase, partial [Puia sp.]|nr:AAA family ATPase [Puia sp.]